MIQESTLDQLCPVHNRPLIPDYGCVSCLIDNTNELYFPERRERVREPSDFSHE